MQNNADSTAWNASDAIIERREHELAKVWEHISAGGINAVQGVMDYLGQIEGQNKRLNRRVDMLEAQIRFLDRLEKLLELEKGGQHANTH